MSQQERHVVIAPAERESLRALIRQRGAALLSVRRGGVLGSFLEHLFEELGEGVVGSAINQVCCCCAVFPKSIRYNQFFPKQNCIGDGCA